MKPDFGGIGACVYRDYSRQRKQRESWILSMTYGITGNTGCGGSKRLSLVLFNRKPGQRKTNRILARVSSMRSPRAPTNKWDFGNNYGKKKTDFHCLRTHRWSLGLVFLCHSYNRKWPAPAIVYPISDYILVSTGWTDSMNYLWNVTKISKITYSFQIPMVEKVRIFPTSTPNAF